MDLHPFKELDFNPKAWINKMFALKGKQSNQAFVLNSVQRLQLYMKQLNIAVQESNAQEQAGSAATRNGQLAILQTETNGHFRSGKIFGRSVRDASLEAHLKNKPKT